MAKFDESKIITALHPEKAEVGKKYWCSDSLTNLKTHIELGQDGFTGTLLQIDEKNFDNDFCIKHNIPINNINITWCRYLYPYEEPKYRPYKNTEEMINDFCERFGVKRTNFGEPFIWVKDKDKVGLNVRKCLITEFYSHSVILGSDSEVCCLPELFNDYTYLDGSPCGKLEN